MINATASRLRYNDVIISMLKSWGVDILEIWEASLLMPEWCHVGGGIDCAHSLNRNFKVRTYGPSQAMPLQLIDDH